MFCSTCGSPSEGNFCQNCGAALKIRPPADADWSHEIRYHVLLRQPEVQAVIARHAGLASNSMTLERFVEDVALHGGAFGAMTAVSTALTHRLIGRMSAPIKTRTEVIPVLPAYVMVAVLCSFAQRGHRFVGAEQLADGCRFEAALRRTPLSAGGELAVGVRREDSGSLVEAWIRIRGTRKDWFKGRRRLDELFTDLGYIPSVFVARDQ